MRSRLIAGLFPEMETRFGEIVLVRVRYQKYKTTLTRDVMKEAVGAHLGFCFDQWQLVDLCFPFTTHQTQTIEDYVGTHAFLVDRRDDDTWQLTKVGGGAAGFMLIKTVEQELHLNAAYARLAGRSLTVRCNWNASRHKWQYQS